MRCSKGCRRRKAVEKGKLRAGALFASMRFHGAEQLCRLFIASQRTQRLCAVEIGLGKVAALHSRFAQPFHARLFVAQRTVCLGDVPADMRLTRPEPAALMVVLGIFHRALEQLQRLNAVALFQRAPSQGQVSIGMFARQHALAAFVGVEAMAAEQRLRVLQPARFIEQ